MGLSSDSAGGDLRYYMYVSVAVFFGLICLWVRCTSSCSNFGPVMLARVLGKTFQTTDCLKTCFLAEQSFCSQVSVKKVQNTGQGDS